MLEAAPEARVRQDEIHRGLLATSKYVTEPNFQVIHPEDLRWLFQRYDDLFLQGTCGAALDGVPLRFRLAPRMTKAGGTTTRYRDRAGKISFEIAIGISLIFDGFREDHRTVTACGLECGNRLEALQRVFEHEIVHLAEQLAWGESECSGARFQGIARRFFDHRTHTHALITRRERAAQSGIRLGSMVGFWFEGERLMGRVNRITKRATVLVEDAGGRRYSDGRRYKTYYVPIAGLEPQARAAAAS